MEESALTQTVRTAWQKSKWIIKGFVVGFIALALLIPAWYVKGIVEERAARQQEAANEVTRKWAGSQLFTGPLLGIPYWNTEPAPDGKSTLRAKHVAWFLPEKLSISGTIDPREKTRGIYRVSLYQSDLKVNGNFLAPDFKPFNIDPGNIEWSEAFVEIGLSDLQGLNAQPLLQWNDSSMELSTVADGETALRTLLPLNPQQGGNFSFNLDLNGSKQLQVMPVGKLTELKLQSTWKDPSFSGNLLPQSSSVNDSGFTAYWKSLAQHRAFPRQWTDDQYHLQQEPVPPPAELTDATETSRTTSTATATSNTAAFGVDMYIPVNGYTKTMRTIKYALLCILLTFAAFFLIETSQKKSVHPFQYGLVGLALVLFYTLLLSISEYLGFNAAYLLSASATIGLIGWFVQGIIRVAKTTTILSVVLVIVYAYIFSLLQLQDYSLLLGSIGLFISLAVIMYFSRKLQW